MTTELTSMRVFWIDINGNQNYKGMITASCILKTLSIPRRHSEVPMSPVGERAYYCRDIDSLRDQSVLQGPNR